MTDETLLEMEAVSAVEPETATAEPPAAEAPLCDLSEEVVHQNAAVLCQRLASVYDEWNHEAQRLHVSPRSMWFVSMSALQRLAAELGYRTLCYKAALDGRLTAASTEADFIPFVKAAGEDASAAMDLFFRRLNQREGMQGATGDAPPQDAPAKPSFGHYL